MRPWQGHIPLPLVPSNNQCALTDKFSLSFHTPTPQISIGTGLLTQRNEHHAALVVITADIALPLAQRSFDIALCGRGCGGQGRQRDRVITE